MVNSLVDAAPNPGFVKIPGAEPLPEYRLVEPLGKGGMGEVWKCEVPGGLLKAIKFVPQTPVLVNGEGAPAEQELQALQHVKSIRHPFMINVERVEVCGGELIIVMELADNNLAQLLAQYQAEGKSGIPRGELLSYLREAAEVLDFMSFQHRLQHLDIKPRNLFLVSHHVKVADFGLVQSLAEGKGKSVGSSISPLYCAPEIFNGQITRFSDQYSLAVTFQELLTGTFPIQGKNPRQLMVNHMTAEPDLSPLPAPDRSLLARALAKDPEQRFPSCMDFIQSLGHGKVITFFAPARVAEQQDSLDQAMADTTPDEPSGAVPENNSDGDSPPGYRLLECVATSPLGDTWRVKAPDGRDRLARILNVPLDRASSLVTKLQKIQHPSLPPLDLLRGPSGRIFLVFDSSIQTLWDRYEECRTEGRPGIPREELLGYLTRAAEALDDLNQKFGMVHLNLQPRNLWQGEEWIYLFEFGWTKLLCQEGGQQSGLVNPRYGAPEAVEKGAGSPADQFSLALIYSELLTGFHPRPNRSGSRNAGSRSSFKLDMLPSCDRPALARALQAEPGDRFASCGDFIRALVGGASKEQEKSSKLPSLLPLALLQGEDGPPESSWPTPEQFITQWLLIANAAESLGEFKNLAYLCKPGKIVEHRCPLRMIPGGLKIRMHDFIKEWNAQVIRQEDNVFEARIPGARTLWQRCFGGKSGLEISVVLQPFDEANAQFVEATIAIKPWGTGMAEEISQVGPAMIENIRVYLQAEPGKRGCERWPCSFPLHLHPVLPDMQVGDPIKAVCKDIAMTGIGFRVPGPLPGEQFYVNIPGNPALAPYCLLVQVVRAAPGVDGQVDVGGTFSKETTNQ